MNSFYNLKLKYYSNKKKIPKNKRIPNAFRKLSERIPKAFRTVPKKYVLEIFFGIAFIIIITFIIIIIIYIIIIIINFIFININ